MIFEIVSVFGRKCAFTENKVKAVNVPENVYRYEVSHKKDEWDTPDFIKKYVRNNFFGTLLSKNPLPIPEDGVLFVDNSEDSKDFVFEGGEFTIDECLNEI